MQLDFGLDMQILEHLGPKTAVPSLGKRDYPKTNPQPIIRKKSRMYIENLLVQRVANLWTRMMILMILRIQM